MTPTRTDRTDAILYQRRRASNNVSLNNTRSDVHASERAGREACSTVSSHVNNEQRSNNPRRDHNREQLINWLMSKDAVAPCFIKDVLSMSESEHAGLPHYFLGRVPCRSVSLVAVIVGATAYEQRIVYILDDGTGTIEYAFRTSQGEAKPESKPSENRDHLRDIRSTAREPTDTNARPEPVVIPVGSVVKVQGKIRLKYNSRELNGDTIVLCRGLGEELKHWQRVTALHKDYYFLPEQFVIPRPSETTVVNAQDTPHTPKSTKVVTSFASTPSAYSTASSSATSSPAKSADDASLLPRLRHPSRLRSRDLTENTFRIYVKHFMDNLRYLNFGPRPSESDLEEEDSDMDSIAEAIDKTPMTPTKKRSAPAPGDECTPRLSRDAGTLFTPRPPRPRPSSASHLDGGGHGDDNEAMIGCTLSFLLRVPELSNLARRVVQAEMRRREKTRQSQAQAQPGTVSVDTSREQRRTALSLSTEGSLPKVKRLFSWAIRKLYQDGSIIIWDGSALSVSLLEPHTALDSSMLYRSSRSDNNTGHSSSRGPSHLFSRHCGMQQQPADNDSSMEDLSDPPSDEEAYASLSTAHLATQVEQTIRSLTALRTARRKGANEKTYMGPAISRRRLLPLPGPTKEEITTHLKRGDDRWKRINAWVVQEALEWLRNNGRVWCVSEDDGGRWELCS